MSNISDLDVDRMGDEPTLPLCGQYHVKLIKHDESVTQRGTVHKCRWQIVGTPPELRSEIGKYIYESYYEYSSIFMKQIATIGWACGIYSKEYLKSLQAKGVDLPMPDLHTWLYCSCIGKVKHEQDQQDASKIYARIGMYDYKPVDHEIVKEAGIVLDEASISNSVPEQAKNTDVF